MFFESIKRRISSANIEKLLMKVFYSKRERLVLFRAELFIKACKKLFFFCISVTWSQNRAVCSVFFLRPLFLFSVLGGQTKTQIQSQI